MANKIKNLNLNPNGHQSETAQLLLQSRLLLSITRSESIDQGQVDLALRQLTEAAAEGLDVERSSVWLYTENHDAIVCVDLYERVTNKHSSGIELKAKDFPAYFQYLREERTLPAHDAHTDPATFEFSEVYLKPLDIKSMLDAPIRKNGQTIGVICNEKVKIKKNWSLTDQAFAGSVADLISRAFVAKDRVHAQESLRSMNENLEKLIEERTRELEIQRESTFQSAKMASLGEMSGGIAHEINTPLATIQLLAGSLVRMAEKNELKTEDVIKFAKRIEDTTQRIGKIIQSLRAFCRDASQDPFEMTEICKIVQDTLLLCREKFSHSQVEIQVGNLLDGQSIECRPIQIQQVLLNLLANSFDAVVEQSGNKWIRINIIRSGSQIAIHVSDSGPEIPLEIRHKIMEPFFTTKEIGKGTGLGLSVSMGLIQTHGGTLSLDSNSKNTTFVIKLPIFQATSITESENLKKVS